MPAILLKLGGLGVWGVLVGARVSGLTPVVGSGRSSSAFMICVHHRHFGKRAAGEVQEMVENTQHGLSAWST